MVAQRHVVHVSRTSTLDRPSRDRRTPTHGPPTTACDATAHAQSVTSTVGEFSDSTHGGATALLRASNSTAPTTLQRARNPSTSSTAHVPSVSSQRPDPDMLPIQVSDNKRRAAVGIREKTPPQLLSSSEMYLRFGDLPFITLSATFRHSHLL